MSKWNTTKLLVIGGLAVIHLIFGFIGSSLQAATGIIGAGGAAMIILGPIVIVFCCLLIKKFGAATILMSIYGVLALPLPTLGAPGFLPKLGIAFGAGLIADITYLFFKKRDKLASFFVGATSESFIGYSILWLGLMFSLPGTDILNKVLLSPIAILLPFIGGFGGYLGYLTYNKLKNTSIIRRIQV